jgi:hypothetical protein
MGDNYCWRCRRKNLWLFVVGRVAVSMPELVITAVTTLVHRTGGDSVSADCRMKPLAETG